MLHLSRIVLRKITLWMWSLCTSYLFGKILFYLQQKQLYDMSNTHCRSNTRIGRNWRPLCPTVTNHTNLRRISVLLHNGGLGLYHCTTVQGPTSSICLCLLVLCVYVNFFCYIGWYLFCQYLFLYNPASNCFYTWPMSYSNHSQLTGSKMNL